MKNLRSTAQSTTTIDVLWSAPDGKADQYSVEWRLGSDNILVGNITVTSGTAYQIMSLNDDNLYMISVHAESNGVRGYNTSIEVKTGE